jgi:hypothetical protein
MKRLSALFLFLASTAWAVTFGDLYQPLTAAHIDGPVEVTGPGPERKTHCWVNVPSVSGALPAFAKPNPGAEHWSATNVDVIPQIDALTLAYLLPAWNALPEVVAAHASGVYPLSTIGVFTTVGVENGYMIGHGRLTALVAGVPAIEKTVRKLAPPEAIAPVLAMVEGYVLPAIRTETGLR